MLAGRLASPASLLISGKKTIRRHATRVASVPLTGHVAAIPLRHSSKPSIGFGGLRNTQSPMPRRHAAARRTILNVAHATRGACGIHKLSTRPTTRLEVQASLCFLKRRSRSSVIVSLTPPPRGIEIQRFSESPMTNTLFRRVENSRPAASRTCTMSKPPW